MMLHKKVKSVTATEAGDYHWNITYSIYRNSWGPFLCKYDFEAFAHDHNNQRKDIQSMQLQIEQPIGVKKEIQSSKVLQNGSRINATIREEGKYAVLPTALSVIVTPWNNKVIITPKIKIS